MRKLNSEFRSALQSEDGGLLPQAPGTALNADKAPKRTRSSRIRELDIQLPEAIESPIVPQTTVRVASDQSAVMKAIDSTLFTARCASIPASASVYFRVCLERDVKRPNFRWVTCKVHFTPSISLFFTIDVQRHISDGNYVAHPGQGAQADLGTSEVPHD